MIWVLDASVALKWFFQARTNETHSDIAVALLQGYVNGHHRLLAPPHFVAEVSAVLAREVPHIMQAALAQLLALAIPVVDEPAVYGRALHLSHTLQHHLFDTLYHAVALQTPGAVLMTADDRYWRVARSQGQVQRLADGVGELR